MATAVSSATVASVSGAVRPKKRVLPKVMFLAGLNAPTKVLEVTTLWWL